MKLVKNNFQTETPILLETIEAEIAAKAISLFKYALYAELATYRQKYNRVVSILNELDVKIINHNHVFYYKKWPKRILAIFDFLCYFTFLVSITSSILLIIYAENSLMLPVFVSIIGLSIVLSIALASSHKIYNKWKRLKWSKCSLSQLNLKLPKNDLIQLIELKEKSDCEISCECLSYDNQIVELFVVLNDCLYYSHYSVSKS